MDWTVEYNEQDYRFELIMWHKNNIMPETVIPLAADNYRSALFEAAAIAVDPKFL